MSATGKRFQPRLGRELGWKADPQLLINLTEIYLWVGLQ